MERQRGHRRVASRRAAALRECRRDAGREREGEVVEAHLCLCVVFLLGEGEEEEERVVKRENMEMVEINSFSLLVSWG